MVIYMFFLFLLNYLAGQMECLLNPFPPPKKPSVPFCYLFNVKIPSGPAETATIAASMLISYTAVIVYNLL